MHGFEYTADVFPYISLILNFISICPADSAVVQCGFSLMSLMINDLRNSMNVKVTKYL